MSFENLSSTNFCDFFCCEINFLMLLLNLAVQKFHQNFLEQIVSKRRQNESNISNYFLY
jgi:hypothetical protein